MVRVSISSGSLEKGWIIRELRFASGKLQTVYDEVKTVSTVQLSPAEIRSSQNAMLDSALRLYREH